MMMQKLFLDWFYFLFFCDKCEEFIEFTNFISSQQLSHRSLVTCNFRQNGLKTFNTWEVRCWDCGCSIKRKFKNKHTNEEFKKLTNVYKVKGRKEEYIIDEIKQKVENQFIL